MKKYPMTLFTIFLLVIFSCQEKIDIEAEKSAVIAVIEEETDAYVDADFPRFTDTYVQDETCVRLTAGKNSYALVEGWDTMGKNFEEIFKDRSPNYQNIKFEKSNYRIKVYTTGAWAIFDETASYDLEGEHFEVTMIGTRVLEKVEGKWKIVFVGIVDTSSYEAAEEAEVGSESTE